MKEMCFSSYCQIQTNGVFHSLQFNSISFWPFFWGLLILNSINTSILWVWQREIGPGNSQIVLKRYSHWRMPAIVAGVWRILLEMSSLSRRSVIARSIWRKAYFLILLEQKRPFFVVRRYSIARLWISVAKEAKGLYIRLLATHFHLSRVLFPETSDLWNISIPHRQRRTLYWR